MSINYNVWGTPEEWRNPNVGSGYEAIEAKLPKLSADSYYDVYYNNLVPLNEIDISNCFWGISKNSLFLSLKYLSPYINNDNVSVDIREVYEEQKDRPAIFTATPNERSASYYYRYSPDKSYTPPDSAIYYRGVVMAFNYQKVKTTPVVYVRPAPELNYQTIYRLDDYISNQRYINNPYIVNIGYYVSYNGSNPLYDLSLATVGHVKGYNVHYNGYLFYARSSGIDNFITAWRETNGSVNNLCQSQIYPENINYNIGDSETAFAYKYSIGDQTQPQIYNYDGDPLWELYTDYMDGSTRRYCVGYAIHVTADNIDDVRNYLFKQMAYIGLPFYYLDSDKTKQIGDTGVYLPKFDDNGVTTGEYEEGQNALTLPNSQWTDGRESGYDPNRTPDGDTGNINNIPNPSNRFSARGLKIWTLYQQNVDEVLQHVNELYLDSQTPVESWQTDFKGVNPSDYIVGLYAMLLNPDKSENTETFQLGVVDFDGELNYYRYNDANYFSCGRVSVPAKGNFLDYEPYTSAELYLPLCGTVDIDMKFFAGHEMEIIYYYDPLTMSCTAAIYRISSSGTTLYKTANGTIGASIPVTSMQMGTYQNKIHALEAAQKQNEMRLATSALAIGIGGAAAVATGGASLIAAGGIIGGAATLASGIEQGKNIEYEIEHTPPAISQTGTAEPQNGFCVGDLIPKLFIKRAKMLTSYDAETYGKTVGFACCINSTVGAFSGFTVYSNVDLSGIPATKTEIDMIRAKLNSGIYI